MVVHFIRAANFRYFKYVQLSLICWQLQKKYISIFLFTLCERSSIVHEILWKWKRIYDSRFKFSAILNLCPVCYFVGIALSWKLKFNISSTSIVKLRICVRGLLIQRMCKHWIRNGKKRILLHRIPHFKTMPNARKLIVRLIFFQRNFPFYFRKTLSRSYEIYLFINKI